MRKQRESGESEGIEGAVLHQRFLFSHGSNYSYFLVCDVFGVGSSPKTEKHHGGHQSTIALAAGGEHPKQPPHSMQVLPMMLHLPTAIGLSKNIDLHSADPHCTMKQLQSEEEVLNFPT